LSIESLIAANQALLAPLEQNLSQAEHLLATLEGEFPSKADLPDINLYKFSLPIDLPVSLPSDLVNQRPDILAAEAQMHVASAKIGVATALMFPSFSLNGTFGTSGTNFGNLTASSGKFWSIGPVATIPLFQGTTLWFGRKAAIDAYQQSRANYRQTVLSAFEQVADSLKALEHDAEALQAQVEAKRAAGEALKLLQANYRAGLVDYLAVLTLMCNTMRRRLPICRHYHSAIRTPSHCLWHLEGVGGTPRARQIKVRSYEIQWHFADRV
jgi:NodT family efflux transporter outer membrane factor (OMF) lipoprotein